MEPTGAGATATPERWLDAAAQLLAARDYAGSKRAVDRALEVSPLIPGADELLAVVDVLLASQRRVGASTDWYAVLQLSSPSPADPAAVKKEYRRLALLLAPGRNSHPGADTALRLVNDAFAVLSDPARKSIFDAEVAAARRGGGEGSFWTTCDSCRHAHEFVRHIERRLVRCPNCCKPFRALECPVPPQIVPGTSTYYCAWGFFPVGFPRPADLKSGNWKPFVPAATWPGSGDTNYPEPVATAPVTRPVNAADTEPVIVMPASSNGSASRKRGRQTARMGPRKKVLGGLKNWSSGEQESLVLGPEAWMPVRCDTNTVKAPPPVVEAPHCGGININEAAKESGDVSATTGVVNLAADDDDMVNVHIDLDASDDLLGDLRHLPFLN